MQGKNSYKTNNKEFFLHTSGAVGAGAVSLENGEPNERTSCFVSSHSYTISIVGERRTKLLDYYLAVLDAVRLQTLRIKSFPACFPSLDFTSHSTNHWPESNTNSTISHRHSDTKIQDTKDLTQRQGQSAVANATGDDTTFQF